MSSVMVGARPEHALAPYHKPSAGNLAANVAKRVWSSAEETGIICRGNWYTHGQHGRKPHLGHWHIAVARAA